MDNSHAAASLLRWTFRNSHPRDDANVRDISDRFLQQL